FDRAKSGGGRCGEPLDQRPLGEQISQIGGEAGHAGLTMRRDVIAGYEVIDTRRCPLTPRDRDCACSPTRPSTSLCCRATASGLRGWRRRSPCYLAPDGQVGQEAFAVIRDAIANLNMVALARVVLARREHVIALEPKGRGLVGTTLRHPYEVRDE